jgi:predicted transposase/invertase (TIGR01784 family)
MLNKFLDPKNDLAFRRIFGTDKNKDILIHFLNDIFGRTTDPIEEVIFLTTRQEPEVAAQRVSIVDVLCQDTLGNRFIIEMQVAKEMGFEKRAQYYAAKAYISQREKGVEYKDLKEVTLLSIADFILFPNKADYLSHHQVLDKQTLEQDLKDFSFSFLELPKFKKKKEELFTMTEKWAYFFKHATETNKEELNSVIGDDLILAKAFEELDRFAWTEADLWDYERANMKRASEKAVLEAALEDGIAIGKQEGISIGDTERAIKTAHKMLLKKMPIEEIMELTDLSSSAIEALQKELAHSFSKAK